MVALAPWAFVLAVHDIDATASWFRDCLGFSITWDDAPDWRLVARDGVRIMVGRCPNDRPASEIGSHNWFGYVSVDDVTAFHAELTARGVSCGPPVDTHYGMREIGVATPDGHRIIFAQDIPK